MNNFINTFSTLYVKNNDLDDLCQIFVDNSIHYDELEELENSNYSHSDTSLIIDRYNRYLKNIFIWKIDNTDYTYIKNMIIDYLKIKDNNLAKQIDSEIINMLNEK